MSRWNPMRWLSQPAAEVKTSAAGPVFSSHVVGRPVWTERDFRRLTEESYNLNAIAYRCVKMISTCAATAEICLYGKGGKEIETHPILDLLQHPSPMSNGAQLMEAIIAFLLLSGNSYVEAVGPEGKAPRELWTPRPDRIKIIAGNAGLPQAYEYEYVGRRIQWPVDQLDGRSELLHLKEFAPLDDWYGLSRIQAAAYGIDQHNASSSHNKALLDNGARPSGALIFEPMKGNMGDVTYAPPEVISAAEKELASRHGGTRNAGKPFVLGGQIRWEEMGLSPLDMDFGNGKADAARDICTAIGVPHTIVVPGSSTYNNVREAKLELYEDTVLPLLDLVLSAMNNWLCPRFGDGLMLKVDLDSISALEPRRETKRKSVTELLTAGVLDADEARDALDYGPRGPEAVKKVDPSVLTALIGAVQTVGLQPLVRYMKSCGLFDPGMTEDSILAAAMALMEQDNPADDLANPNADTNADPNQDSNDQAPKDTSNAQAA